MQPHQQRVVDEKADLDGRIPKLREFINGASRPTFLQLPHDEQRRMLRQLDLMRELSDVLGERIAAFPASAS